MISNSGLGARSVNNHSTSKEIRIIGKKVFQPSRRRNKNIFNFPFLLPWPCEGKKRGAYTKPIDLQFVTFKALCRLVSIGFLTYWTLYPKSRQNLESFEAWIGMHKIITFHHNCCLCLKNNNVMSACCSIQSNSSRTLIFWVGFEFEVRALMIVKLMNTERYYLF